MLDGAWEAQNGAGSVMIKIGVQEMKMPTPPAGRETIAMPYRDGKVITDMALFDEAVAEVAPLDCPIALAPIE